MITSCIYICTEWTKRPLNFLKILFFEARSVALDAEIDTDGDDDRTSIEDYNDVDEDGHSVFAP